MAENKKVDINKYYDKIAFFEKITKYILYSNILLLFVSMNSFEFQNYFYIINIILCIAYVILTKSIDMYLKNITENERRKILIKNSFNVNITNNDSNNYYNNTEKESIKKMGINCLESLFFTKFISNKMSLTENIKISAILLLYIILLIKSKTWKDFVLFFGETIFILEYLFGYLKFCYFKKQVINIYDKLNNAFIISPPKEENILTAEILDATMDYECLKYFCKISLSSNIFVKYNPILSKQWDDIYHKKIEGKITKT